MQADICCCANRDLIKCHCSEWKYIYMCKPICVFARKWRNLPSCFVVVNKSEVFYSEGVDLMDQFDIFLNTLVRFLVFKVNMKLMS